MIITKYDLRSTSLKTQNSNSGIKTKSSIQNQVSSISKGVLWTSIQFIGAGDDDWNHTEGKKYNVEYQTVLLYQELRKQLNIPAELRIINGGHSWKVWKPLFTEAIQLMFAFARDGK